MTMPRRGFRRSGRVAFRALAAVVLAAAIVAACAPVSKLPEVSAEAAKREREIQYELAFQQLLRNTQRVHKIAYPILKANAALCGESVRQGIGFHAANKFNVPKDYRAAAEKIAGIGDEIKVIAVAEGSAAAGFREGDVLATVNGWEIPKGDGAIRKLHERLDEIAAKKTELAFAVNRGGKTESLRLTTDTVCKYGYKVSESADANAYADGDNIFIQAGIIRLARDDNDLATVIGHEIAHNLMDHLTKQRGNAALGTVVDILFAGFGVNTQGAFGNLGGRVFSQEFEAEADYVGLYLMARAGFRIDDVALFWRRMAVEHPGSIRNSLAGTHPATPERFLALEKSIAEIKAKQAAGKPLLPEKDDSPTPPPAVSPTQ